VVTGASGDIGLGAARGLTGQGRSRWCWACGPPNGASPRPRRSGMPVPRVGRGDNARSGGSDQRPSIRRSPWITVRRGRTAGQQRRSRRPCAADGQVHSTYIPDTYAQRAIPGPELGQDCCTFRPHADCPIRLSTYPEVLRVTEPDHGSWNLLTIAGTGTGSPRHRPACRATLGVTWPRRSITTGRRGLCGRCACG
jgi:hypothetical protein